MRILSFSQQWILRTFLNIDHWFYLPEPARPPSVQLWTCRGGQPGVTRLRSGRAEPAQTRRAADLSALARSSVTQGRHRRGWRGSGPPHFKKRWCRPPRTLDISVTFFLKLFFAFSNIFKIKWPKSEEKLNFGGRWVWVPMNPTSDPPPQSKLRGDALAVTSQHPVTNEKFRIYISQQSSNIIGWGDF